MDLQKHSCFLDVSIAIWDDTKRDNQYFFSIHNADTDEFRFFMFHLDSQQTTTITRRELNDYLNEEDRLETWYDWYDINRSISLTIIAAAIDRAKEMLDKRD